MGTQNSTTTGRKSALPVLLIIMLSLIFVAIYFPYQARNGDKAPLPPAAALSREQIIRKALDQELEARRNASNAESQNRQNALNEALQNRRKALIQEAVDQRIFYKVDASGRLPHLWVTPTFKALDFDAKSNFVNVVYAYSVTENPEHDTVMLYDSLTGKTIGKYSATFGLHLD